ncbi:hypothetical protein HH308_24385 [Gordonia sp. TBRC 11910]|uniref:Patatin-like phospholipase n=1 Tax=Gordonia asplenii TaxID=2725283 RepID=A0A848L1N3_9ACTN|nr:hypothetical protein [Gordonia asplenii]NMO04362.1 hypothetical protein [Gordonia asplenii]
MRINARLAALIRRGNKVLAALAVVGAIVAVVGVYLVWLVSGKGCRDVTLFAQFTGLPNSGSAAKLRQTLTTGWDCADAPLQTALLADLVFVFGCWLLSTAVVLGGWWRYDAPRLVATAKYIPLLPLAVAALDLIENAVTALTIGGGTFARLGAHPIARSVITTAASAKWFLALILVIVTIMSGLVWISRRDETIDERPCTRGSAPLYLGAATAQSPLTESDRERLAPAVELNATLDADPPTRRDIGLSASGGGIRATAFTLGVIAELESHGVMKSVTRITAVSGGSWGAAAWVLAKAADADPARERGSGETPLTSSTTASADGIDRHTVAESVIDRLLATPTVAGGGSAGSDEPWMSRLRYLFNGRGGVLGPILWVGLCTLSTVLLIVGLTYLIAWLPGYTLGRTFLFGDTFHPCDRIAHDMRDTCTAIPVDWHNPGIYLAVIAILVLLGTSLSRWIAVTWKPSLILAFFGLAIFFYTALMPAFFSLVQRGGVSGSFRIAWTYLLATVGLSTVGTQLWRTFGGEITGRLSEAVTRYLPRLLGIVLAVVTTIGGVSVLYFTAVSSVPPPSKTSITMVVFAGLLGALYLFAGPSRPSLNQIFSKRLGRSFDITAAFRGRLRPANTAEWQGSWAWLRNVAQTVSDDDSPRIPELVLCCSQQRNGVAPGGLPAESLTISQYQVTRGYEREPTADYLARTASVRYLGKLHEYKLDLVAPWLAVSGAAVSSAMGRKNLGSTNAVLAAFHANLGIWIPNLQPPGNPALPIGSRPRISYILKEVLGWYNPTDRYIFATDGGHWENLGLIEQLRASRRTIVCIDSGADPPGSFTALREALDLATLELNYKVTVDDLEGALTQLLPTNGRLPGTLATRIDFTVEVTPDRPKIHGRIYYAKLQLSADMPAALRLFAKEDRRFPSYSTLNQFLSDEQFARLIQAGRHAGQLLCAMLAEDQVVGRG